jgi:hypothetical protein
MSQKENRPAFPALYASLWPVIVRIGRDCGYGMGLHGSLAKDMDVMAMPWTEEARPPGEVAAAVEKATGFKGTPNNPGKMPHGRLAWTLLEAESGAYIDLSIMPPTPTGPNEAEES